MWILWNLCWVRSFLLTKSSRHDIMKVKNGTAYVLRWIGVISMIKIFILLAISTVSSLVLNKCLSLKSKIIREVIIVAISLLEVLSAYFLFSSLISQIISLILVLLVSVFFCFVLFFKQKKHKTSEWLDHLISVYIPFYVVLCITVFI